MQYSHYTSACESMCSESEITFPELSSLVKVDFTGGSKGRIMPGARTVFWAALASGAAFSAIGGLAAERWTLDGVDTYYFGASAPDTDHRISTPADVDDEAPTASAENSVPPPPVYAAAREVPETAAAIGGYASRWQHEIDADDLRWQARMDAELRSDQHASDLAEEHDLDANDRGPATARTAREADAVPPSTSDAPAPAQPAAHIDAEDPA